MVQVFNQKQFQKNYFLVAMWARIVQRSATGETVQKSAPMPDIKTTVTVISSHAGY